MTRAPTLVCCLAWLSACASVPRTGSAVGWSEVRTADIVLRTDLDAERARERVAEMQQMHDALRGHVLSCAFASGGGVPFAVTILRDRGVFDAAFGRALAGAFIENGSSDEARRRVVIRPDSTGGGRQVFQHELTHALVERCYPGAPRWLHEGFAGFLETAVLHRHELRIGIPPYVFVGDTMPRAHLAFGVVVVNVPFDTYVRPSALRALPADAFFGHRDDRSVSGSAVREARYATAWAMVHLFEVGGDRRLRHAFDTYLRDLRAGMAAEAAWARNFPGFDDDSAVEAYALRPTYDYLALPIDELEAPSPVLRRMSEAEAHLELAILFWEHDDDAHRPAFELHANAALAEATTRARARVLLAEALDRRGEARAASLEIERGLVDDPDDATLLRIHLEYVCRRLEAEGLGAPPTLAADAARLERVARTAVDTMTAARAYFFAGDRARAQAASEAALAADEGSVAVLAGHAEMIVRLGLPIDPLPFLDRAIAKSGSDPQRREALLRFRARLVARR